VFILLGLSIEPIIVLPILDLVGELPPYSTGGKIHALERIFGYMVLSAGYRIEGI